MDHYIGKRTHFLTASTYFLTEPFRAPAACELARSQLLRASGKHSFEIIAYTPMPDHIHVLIEGRQDDSDFVKWVNLFRQLSGYWEKRRSGKTLWREGFWDYTLRGADSSREYASYIAWNPVEAGLVAKPEDYPHTFSERYTISEIAAFSRVGRGWKPSARSDG